MKGTEGLFLAVGALNHSTGSIARPEILPSTSQIRRPRDQRNSIKH